jgi:hypothetical protein
MKLPIGVRHALRITVSWIIEKPQPPMDADFRRIYPREAAFIGGFMHLSTTFRQTVPKPG